MQTLTDYIVLQDGTRTISASGSSISISFNLPADFVRGTLRAKPIIGFMAEPAGAQTNFTVRVNTQTQRNYALAPGSFRVIQEAFNGNILSESNNTLTIDVTSNSPSQLRVADLVLWFQRRLEN